MSDQSGHSPVGWSEAESVRVRQDAINQRDAAEQLVVEISRKRLAALQAGPRSKAASSVHDHSLTREDQQRLAEWLAEWPVIWKQKRPFRFRNPFSFRWGLALIGAVATVVPLGLALQQTPIGIVTLKEYSVVDWQQNGKRVGMQGLQPGTKLQALAFDEKTGEVKLRYWSGQQGYIKGSLQSKSFYSDRSSGE